MEVSQRQDSKAVRVKGEGTLAARLPWEGLPEKGRQH